MEDTRHLKISKSLIRLSILLMLIPMSFLSLNKKAVYAGTMDNWVADLIGNDSAGGTHHVKNGVANTRTGYMCYLLTKDGGSVPESAAYAFKSPGYNGLPNSQWLGIARKGGSSVTQWTGKAPWGCTPWTSGGILKTVI